MCKQYLYLPPSPSSSPSHSSPSFFPALSVTWSWMKSLPMTSLQNLPWPNRLHSPPTEPGPTAARKSQVCELGQWCECHDTHSRMHRRMHTHTNTHTRTQRGGVSEEPSCTRVITLHTGMSAETPFGCTTCVVVPCVNKTDDLIIGVVDGGRSRDATSAVSTVLGDIVEEEYELQLDKKQGRQTSGNLGQHCVRKSTADEEERLQYLKQSVLSCHRCAHSSSPSNVAPSSCMFDVWCTVHRLLHTCGEVESTICLVPTWLGAQYAPTCTSFCTHIMLYIIQK